MEKGDKLKKRYILGGIALIIFQLLLMHAILEDKSYKNRNELSNEIITEQIVEKQESSSRTANNVLVYPKEMAVNARSVTLIGMGLIGVGYLFLFKEEREKKEARE